MKKFIFAAFLAIGLVAMLAPQPAFAQEDKPFTIHGEVRSRAEYTNNAADFSDKDAPGTHSTDQSVFFPYRFRIAAEGNFIHNVHSWIEFQQDGTWGEEGSPTQITSTNTSNRAILYQGNVTFDQLWSKSFSLRLGRQEIVAGNGLLLGNEEFYTGTSHDGAVGTWHLKRVNVMVWYTRPNENTINNFDATTGDPQSSLPTTGRNTDFLGGYATWNFGKEQVLDVYLMDLRDHQVSGVTTPFTLDTVGARYAHDETTKTSFIWNIEFAKQFGKLSDNACCAGAGNDFEGQAIEGWFGFNWKTGKNVHRFYGRYEMASGDDTSTTDKNEGFQPIFGDNHNRTGRGDWFRLADATTNLGPGPTTTGGLVAWSVGYNGFYNNRHELGAAYWKYKLEQDNGGPDGDSLGDAFDLWYGFNYSRNVNFLVSVSELSPDDALTGTGPLAQNDSVQRYYAQARLRF